MIIMYKLIINKNENICVSLFWIDIKCSWLKVVRVIYRIKVRGRGET